MDKKVDLVKKKGLVIAVVSAIEITIIANDVAAVGDSGIVVIVAMNEAAVIIQVYLLCVC